LTSALWVFITIFAQQGLFTRPLGEGGVKLTGMTSFNIRERRDTLVMPIRLEYPNKTKITQDHIMEYQIAPSILSANFAKLGEEVDNVLASGADIVHFDVMDNHYVPNLTIGPLVCEALRKHGVTAPIDVHLMVKPVDRIIPDFAKAGATYITFHPEASEHIDRTIGLIKESGCKAGLVFNPATPLDILEYTLPKLDMVLLMSVNPGFGGQKFIPHVLDKARQVRKLINAGNYNCRLEIDGGVGPANIREVAEAGVDTFVAGSAVFGKRNDKDKNQYNTILGELRAELAKVVR
jgi:ribulose-phosphate 3-epimerase